MTTKWSHEMSKLKFGDKEYTGVAERLKEFRQTNPRASIETTEKFLEDGSLVFKATIVKDRADEYSATSTGTARYTAQEANKPKAFEKLETISIGRALATLGYLNDGQVATTEEMEEFESYRMDKSSSYEELIGKATSNEDLKNLFMSMGADYRKELTPAINRKKLELANASTS